MVNFVRPKTLRSALWCYPIFTVEMRLLDIVTIVTSLETVKIEFRHLRFFLKHSWPIASRADTDVGMHGLLSSQSCYHSVLIPCWFALWTSGRFFHPTSSQFSLYQNLAQNFCPDYIFIAKT